MAATNLTSPLPVKVRRHNRLPIAIGIGAVIILVLTYLYLLSTRKHRQYDTTSHTDYSQARPLFTPSPEVEKITAPVPPPVSVAVKEEAPPSPPATAPPQDDIEKMEREHRKKILQAQWDRQAKREESRFSRSLKLVEQRDEERKSALRASALVPLSGSTTTGMAAPVAGSVAGPMPIQNGYAQQRFPQQQLNQQPQQAQAGQMATSYLIPPVSPFMLRQGTRVPAVLEQWVTSDAQGAWTARVAVDVFDSIHSRSVLLPAGSVIFGYSEVEMPTNQQPLLLLSARTIHLPDGSSLDVGRTFGQDGMGIQGLTDIVNKHLWQKWGSAAALSLITAGVRMASYQGGGNSSGYYLSPADAAASGTGQVLGQAAGEELRKKMAIRPTVILEAGYPLNLTLTQDYAFLQGPYQPQEQPQ